MLVQKIRLRDNSVRFLLLDDDYAIIEPVRKYLKHLDNLGRSIYTLRSYAYHLKLYFEFLKEAGLDYAAVDEPGRHITVLTDFIGHLKSWEHHKVISLVPKRTARTINVIMNAVLGFYRFLEMDGDIPARQYFVPTRNQPFQGLLSELYAYKGGQRSYFRLREEEHGIEARTREQIGRLVESCDFLRDKLLLLVMYEGGLRLGEVLNLYVEDFVVWQNKLRIRQHKGTNPFARVKNMSADTLDIPGYVMRLFCRYIAEEYPCKDYRYVFVNLRGKNIGKPLQADTVEMKFKQLSRHCGMKVHPHVLRHSHATELIEVGDWDVLDVQKRLRHKHVQTTIKAYIHLSDQYKREKFLDFYKKVKGHEDKDDHE